MELITLTGFAKQLFDLHPIIGIAFVCLGVLWVAFSLIATFTRSTVDNNWHSKLGRVFDRLGVQFKLPKEVQEIINRKKADNNNLESEIKK